MADVYLVTGANGCIGSWVVKTLVERGARVVALDQGRDRGRLEAIMSAAALAGVDHIVADVTDAAQIQWAMDDSRATHVVHLAGLPAPACRTDPVRGALTNVVGTLNVFDAARVAGVARVVYASSVAVYGRAAGLGPVTEASPRAPTSLYGAYQSANEDVARVYFVDHGLSSVGLRPSIVYGVGRDTGMTSDPTKAMRAAVLRRPFHIGFDGSTDIQFVADTADAFVASAQRAPAGALRFNLHGEHTSVGRLVEIIEAELPVGSRGLITFGGPALSDADRLDDGAIRRTIGGLRATPLAQGVRETIAAFTVLRDGGRLTWTPA